jgi:TBC1 domain family member 14
MIKADLDRTQYVFDKAEVKIDIQEIMTAFVCFRPEIGYIQGMFYPLIMLLARMDKYNAFKCFANLILKSDLLSSAYQFKKLKLDAYNDLFDFLMHK